MNDHTIDHRTMHSNPCLCLVSPLAFIQTNSHALLPKTVWKFAASRQVLSSNPHRLNINPVSLFPFWPSKKSAPSLPTQAKYTEQKRPKTRIGIVGGGIAGVTVAHALVKRLVGPSDNTTYEMTILEGDPQGSLGRHDGTMQPQWIAATARNANSLVPAASMHLFSRQTVVCQVMRDTVREWYWRQKERFDHVIPKLSVAASLMPARSDDFAVPPPYFALHLIRCLGPSASSDERWTFVRFLSHFLYTSLWLGNAAADKRSHNLCLLAQANRATYLAEVARYGDTFKSNTGHSKGFLSLHRTLHSAQEAVKEAHEHGEEAELIDWKQAVLLEPHLGHLPIQPLYAVRRPNDYTASCETFVRHWRNEIVTVGVKYTSGKVNRLETIPTPKQNGKKYFRVTIEDGTSFEFDVLILAAGINTPLMATQLGVEKYCPTYPLRGFSLTLPAWQQENTREKGNLLHQPFSLDSMYCSSVTPWMARIAGFGEFVGYRDKADAVPSVGPAVLARYAKAAFPDAVKVVSEDAVPCFRPISPDDLPLIGEVAALPGLFLHTGHGTLGWTTALATGDCVAQAVVDRLEGRDSQEGLFALSNDHMIDRKIVSPNRFVD
jgi:glycine/D-amino acid oxidase-like deaminating enzyme